MEQTSKQARGSPDGKQSLGHLQRPTSISGGNFRKRKGKAVKGMGMLEKKGVRRRLLPPFRVVTTSYFVDSVSNETQRRVPLSLKRDNFLFFFMDFVGLIHKKKRDS